eukprot:5348653-Prymnesium_polylepis.2
MPESRGAQGSGSDRRGGAKSSSICIARSRVRTKRRAGLSSRIRCIARTRSTIGCTDPTSLQKLPRPAEMSGVKRRASSGRGGEATRLAAEGSGVPSLAEGRRSTSSPGCTTRMSFRECRTDFDCDAAAASAQRASSVTPGIHRWAKAHESG